MLGKNHAKLFYDIMNKLFQTFQSPYSLHKPPHPYCFTLPSSHEFCGQIFENIFFSLDLLVQKLFFDKNHWFQLLSTKNDWIVSLFLISITLHLQSICQPFYHVFCWRRSFGFRWKLYCYSSPSHITRENFVSRCSFCLSFFFFFVFGFWAIETTMSRFTWKPKWTQTNFKSQTALKCRSVYMAIYMATCQTIARLYCTCANDVF